MPSWSGIGVSWWRRGAILGRLESLLAHLQGALGPLGGHDPTIPMELRVLRPQETSRGFIFWKCLNALRILVIFM